MASNLDSVSAAARSQTAAPHGRRPGELSRLGLVKTQVRHLQVMEHSVEISELSLAIEQELSSVSYFYGYDRPPFDSHGNLDDTFNIDFVGRVTYPEAFVNRLCKLSITPIREEYRQKFKKHSMIGTLVVEADRCDATVEMASDSIDQILRHYFLFRQIKTDHFHISLHLKDFQQAEGKLAFRVFKLNSGWGE